MLKPTVRHIKSNYSTEERGKMISLFQAQMGAADLVPAYVNGCSTGIRNSNIFKVDCKPAPPICTGNLV